MVGGMETRFQCRKAHNPSAKCEAFHIAPRLFFMFLFFIPLTIRQQSIIYPHKFSTEPFERTCLWHVDQIKKKLGISGILTNEYAWRCLPDESISRPGVQIDLLIDRSDGIIDVCEMKYSKNSYTITSDYSDELARKRNVFQAVTGTKKAIHSIMVTTDGLTRNEYWGDIQAEVQLDDLYEL